MPLGGFGGSFVTIGACDNSFGAYCNRSGAYGNSYFSRSGAFLAHLAHATIVFGAYCNRSGAYCNSVLPIQGLFLTIGGLFLHNWRMRQ
jgi:hypothetical protein